MTLTEWIKANVREDADPAEGIKLAEDLDPLKNLESKEDALGFMRRNDLFNSALDAETRKAVEGYREKYESTKLPELLKEEREKALREANPEETPEQKRLRELEDQIKERDRREATEQRKAALRQKASEIGFDPLRAERYAAYGEEAEEILVKDHEQFTETLNRELEKRSKERYSTSKPDAGEGSAAKTMKRADFDALPASERRAVFADGTKLVDD